VLLPPLRLEWSKNTVQSCVAMLQPKDTCLRNLFTSPQLFSDYRFLAIKLNFVYFSCNKKLKAIHELLCWRLQNQELTGQCLDLKHALNRSNIERIISPERSVDLIIFLTFTVESSLSVIIEKPLNKFHEIWCLGGLLNFVDTFQFWMQFANSNNYNMNVYACWSWL
jgi:hypothetical protein